MSDSPSTGTSAVRQIAKAAGTVMVAFLIGNLIGLLRGVVIANAFGTSGEYDSFSAANRLTETLYNLMAGGALGSAFIPTFIGLLTKDDRNGAWKLASSITNLLILVLSGVAILMAIFAPFVVRYGLFIINPAENLEEQTLTVTLLRIMLPSIAVFGLSGLVIGILNSHQKFWLPAIAPAMYSIGIIIGVIFFPHTWGIYRLAWGALFGSFLHLLIQLPALIKLPERKYSLTLGRGNPAVRTVLRLMGPRIFGVAVVQLNFIVNTIIALSLPEGSVSSISFAFAIMLMPQAAIAQSIAIASLPTFSAQAAQNKLDEMRSSLVSSLRGVLLLALPASLGLILLRVPLIQFMYERGEFTAQSTQMVAWALLFYAAGLVGHSVVEVISRAFYAVNNTRTPVIIGAIAMTINLALSLILSHWFGVMGLMPHGGLALANAVATALEMVALIVMMRKRLNGLEGKRLWQAVGQSAIGTIVMSGLVVLFLQYTPNLSALVRTVGGGVIGVGAYSVVMLALKTPEISQV
ncbi:MAG TPA: murein biosynthesis integral membrane protein MurJ, partial [Longilinea sp.]|nr:murein biosynthesis integral membrane protein MurJ [Longilinea sp.]